MDTGGIELKIAQVEHTLLLATRAIARRTGWTMDLGDAHPQVEVEVEVTSNEVRFIAGFEGAPVEHVEMLRLYFEGELLGVKAVSIDSCEVEIITWTLAIGQPERV